MPCLIKQNLTFRWEWFCQLMLLYKELVIMKPTLYNRNLHADPTQAL
jgi:hypothetical protein